MNEYFVIFSRSAEAYIYESYEWGCREWGEEAAMRWAVELRTSVEKILKIFPSSQSVAPESDDLLFEIRQMIVGRFGRYRILFRIDGKTVHILHVRAPFIQNENP